MAQEQARQLLQQGIAAARAGRASEARDLFRQSVRLDPQNETTWLWMSGVAQDDKERLFCLRQLLTINPDNEHALKGLRALGVEPTAPAEAAPSVSVPQLDDEKYLRVQQVVDDFLRRYNPAPADVLDVRWTRKQKRRYGERGAQRLRQAAFAVSAIVVLAVAGFALLVATGILGEDEGEPESVAVRATATQLPTATITPTPSLGPSPTPFPGRLAIPSTPELGATMTVAPGSPFETATPIYPPLNSLVRRVIEGDDTTPGAADYYSIGAYSTAMATLGPWHQEALEKDKVCYSSVAYYLALSQSGEGNYSAAIDTLQEALDFESENRPLCNDDPALLYAGLAQIWYARNNPLEALQWSETALEEDPYIVPAILVKAQVELDRNDIDSAWRTVVENGLNRPRFGGGEGVDIQNDVSLLTLAASIELARGNYANLQEALKYVGKALYINPSLLPALRLQAETYMALADFAERSGEARDTSHVQYASLVVQSAQALLHYYPGEVVGYLYLAEGRLGEGNLSLAEAALKRIVSSERQLSETDEQRQVVIQAHRLLADLYYQANRLAEARENYDWLWTVSNDYEALERWIELGFAVGETTGSTFEQRLNDLMDSDPGNPTYLLWQAQQQSDLLLTNCVFVDPGVRSSNQGCAYQTLLAIADGMLDTTSGQTLADSDQRADAYAFSGQARYWQTKLDASLVSELAEVAYRLALDEIEQALAVRDRPVDRFYRAVILQELGYVLEQRAIQEAEAREAAAQPEAPGEGEPADDGESEPEATPADDGDVREAALEVAMPYYRQACEEYQWLAYWSAVYAYPFGDEIERRLDTLGDVVVMPEAEDEPLITATPTTPAGTGRLTPVATARDGEEPTPVRTPTAAPTRRVTATPAASPTATREAVRLTPTPTPTRQPDATPPTPPPLP